MRPSLPRTGTDWETLRRRMVDMGRGDADWRHARTTLYIFNAGEEVREVGRQAYDLFISENALGSLAFPSLARMEADVVGFGLSLLNAPEGAAGSMTSGGTESILLAVKSCRDRWAALGNEPWKAQIVAPWSAHPAFDKAAHLFGLEVVRVPLRDDMLADVEAMAAAIGPRTMMLIGSAPCFPYGLIDPIEELGRLAQERDLWLHVDSCVGGYLAPFVRMNGADLPPFDLGVPGVSSISADLHKYGYAHKGASTVLYGSAELYAFQPYRFGDWPNGIMETPTFAGTRPGGAIACAWAVMNFLGEEGYRAKARDVVAAREGIEAGVRAMGMEVLGQPQLGITGFRSTEVDTHAVADGMRARGWFSARIQKPQAIHLMLSPAHVETTGAYLADLAEVVEDVRIHRKVGDGRGFYA